VEADEQVRRAIPVIRAIRSASDVAISIDTTSSAVAQQAIQAGAEAINDVSGGHDDPHMLDVAARARCGLIVMHRARKPTQDSYSDRYRGDEPMSGDVVASVAASLRAALERCDRAGVKRECVAIDPGVGFGKTVEQNMQLIARAHEFVSLGRPLVSGLSRKSFVGRVALGRDSTPDERLSGTIAISVMHMLSGASIFRVHDVAPVAQALRAARAVRAHGP
jgi:dihydropteroate synthase